VPERIRLGEFRRQAEVATDRGGDRRDWLNGMVPANGDLMEATIPVLKQRSFCMSWLT
jgi:hypothetical protein